VAAVDLDVPEAAVVAVVHSGRRTDDDDVVVVAAYAEEEDTCRDGDVREEVAAGAVVLAPMDLPTLRAPTLDVALYRGVVDMEDNRQEDKGSAAVEAV